MKVPISFQIPSPLQRHVLKGQEGRRVPVWFKRDDLIDDVISGNKWRKLRPNLSKIHDNGFRSLVTIGGAFSNHLVATARACQLSGVKSTGLVKSGTLDLRNPTLQFCASCGMTLKRVDRSWTESDSLAYSENEEAYWLPEGGSNDKGVSGIGDLAKEITAEITPDVVFVSVGSGGTLAGLVRALPNTTRIMAVSSFDTDRMSRMMYEKYDLERGRVDWPDRFAGSSFGKYDRELMKFAESFYGDFGIPLDPIYTVKTAYVMHELLLGGALGHGENIVFIHTGGLQGWRGYKYRFPSSRFPDYIEDLISPNPG